MKPEFSGAEWSKVGGKLKSATDSTHLRMRTGAQVTFNPFARNPSHRSFLFSRFQSFSSELALAHDPLVTVGQRLDAVLEHTVFCWQRSNDCESTRCFHFKIARDQLDRLIDFEFVNLHGMSLLFPKKMGGLNSKLRPNGRL
jgi:hypothetical protein